MTQLSGARAQLSGSAGAARRPLAHWFWLPEGRAYTAQLNVFVAHSAIIGGFVLMSILGVRPDFSNRRQEPFVDAK